MVKNTKNSRIGENTRNIYICGENTINVRGKTCRRNSENL